MISITGLMVLNCKIFISQNINSVRILFVFHPSFISGISESIYFQSFDVRILWCTVVLVINSFLAFLSASNLKKKFFGI